MNKIQIVLLLSVLGTLTSVAGYSYSSTETEFFITCNAQLTAYSNYANTATATIQTQIGKIFSCGSTFQTTESRNICETANGLATADASVQKYYTECLIPKFNSDFQSCTANSKCATESDKCSTCTTVSTCSTYRNSGTALYTDYSAAVITPGCAAIASSCPVTMTPILLDTCQQYQSWFCQDTWMKAHPADPCYDAYVCRWSSAAILSASILAFLAFLMF